MLIPAIIYGTPAWWAAAVLVYFLMFCVGVDIGVHRYFSHKSFKTSKFYELFFGVWMTLATVGSSLAWAGMHRQHHKNADTLLDPHTPHGGKNSFLGAFKAYIGLWKFYVARPEFTSDLRKSSLHRFFHFYYFLVILIYCILLYLIHPLALVFLYCVPATFSFHAASMIVTFGHLMGDRSHETPDKSRNSLLVHWLTMGEGLHNLHHAEPWQYRYSGGPASRWYFFDLPGFFIEKVFKVRDA
jgi:fatty-acid desaturase